MKKLFVFLFAAFAALSLGAQNGNPMLQPLPNDPAVRVGTLDNGLTYYIRKNNLPEHRAEFYLATKAGGIFETPDQDGLAHFLEHMCFNGTERFPGKGILNYLQSIGAEFGRNINAGTGFEQTTYMLNNIPVERPAVADSCILILSEYAHYVSNELSEIDLERPVIVEERRSRRNASWRSLEASLPYWFGDTKYATCTLIGGEENLKTFKKESLDNFYSTWYNPDRQAVVVVGDIDPDRVEAKIKEYFGRIPKNENPAPDPVIAFPSNSEPAVGIITDPETTSPEINIIWKSEADPKEYNATLIGEMNNIVKAVIRRIMYERFYDITSKPGAPFISGGLYISKLIYDAIDAVEADVTLRDDNILEGFRSFYTEIERARRFGFNDEEFERAKSTIVAGNEAAVEKASTRKNAEFINPIINNFFDLFPYMEPAIEKQIDDMILGQLNAAAISQMVQDLFTDENLVVLYNGPAKEGIATPTAQQLLDVMEEVKNSDIQPLESEELASEFLDADKLKGSAVKTSKAGDAYGTTKWILKNGVEVTLLPTDYRKDQIQMYLWREGGRSNIDNKDLDSFDSNIWAMFMDNTGVAGFKGTQVSKMLSGKFVSVTPFINDLTNGIEAQSNKKDLETAFQLMYLFYTQPRFDAEEYQTGIDQLSAMLPGLEASPNFQLQKKFYEVAYGNNPRKQVTSKATLENASINTVSKVYSSLFNKAKGLKLTIVGDFIPEEIQPLVEKYIGSIKKGGKATAWVDRNIDFVEGTVKVADPVTMETPLTTCILLYSTPISYNGQNKAALNAISYILDMRYTASLREDIGGTYGASSFGQINDLPTSKAVMQVAFACKPELADTLVYTAEKEFEELAKDGPTKEEFEKTVLNLKKNIPESRLNNGYWMGLIKGYSLNPVEMDKGYENGVNALTPEIIKSVAAQLVGSGNLVEFRQIPE